MVSHWLAGGDKPLPYKKVRIVRTSTEGGSAFGGEVLTQHKKIDFYIGVSTFPERTGRLIGKVEALHSRKKFSLAKKRIKKYLIFEVGRSKISNDLS